MRIKFIAFTIIICSLTLDSMGQMDYDTVVSGTAQYGDLNFKLRNSKMTEYVVSETDLSIRNGVIEKNNVSLDTIALRAFTIDGSHDGYEIRLSDKTWVKILFGRHCQHLADSIDSYPTLTLRRNRLSKTTSFLDPTLVGNFMKANYLKRIECIDSSDDKYMRPYILEDIEKIENGDINQFSEAMSSHFMHVLSLFDLLVPTESSDTLVCSMTSTNQENPVQFSYLTTKTVNPDSTITYYYTDAVGDDNSITEQYSEKLCKVFEEYHTEEEKRVSAIRLSSRKSEDRSYIELTKTGEFSRYLRIIESSMLDADLLPTQSIYNYEIRKILEDKSQG